MPLFVSSLPILIEAPIHVQADTARHGPRSARSGGFAQRSAGQVDQSRTYRRLQIADKMAQFFVESRGLRQINDVPSAFYNSKPCARHGIRYQTRYGY